MCEVREALLPSNDESEAWSLRALPQVWAGSRCLVQGEGAAEVTFERKLTDAPWRTVPLKRHPQGPSLRDKALLKALLREPMVTPTPLPAKGEVVPDLMATCWAHATRRLEEIVSEGAPYPSTFHVELTWGEGQPPREYLFSVGLRDGEPRMGRFLGRVRGRRP